MAAKDKFRSLQSIVPGTADNVRYKSVGENNKRTERWQMRVTAEVDLTGAGTALRNRGSVLAFLGDIGFTDGGTDKVVMDARLARFVAEKFAPSPLPATRLTGVGIQTTTIEETVPLFMSAYGTANPNETKYVEVNKQLAQEVFITPDRALTRIATNGGALAGSVNDLTATVEQVFDDMVQTPPWLSPFTRQLVSDVTGTNPAFRIDLRGSRYIRGIAIQQDSTDGEVSDIINALVLRGDRDAIIGDRAVPWADLVQAQAYEDGGELPPGYLFIDFARYGRLSSLWNPYQDTNLRLELDVQPTASAGGGSRIRVAMIEYERTAATAKPLPLDI